MKILPLLGVVLLTGACHFLGRLEQMCKVSPAEPSCGPLIRRFGDFWDFLLLWEQQPSRGSRGMLWFVAAAAFAHTLILSGATEKWPVKIAGKHTLQ